MTDAQDHQHSQIEPLGDRVLPFDPHRLIAAFRRRLKAFGAVAILVLAVVVLISFQQTRKYTAVANVLIAPHKDLVVDMQSVLAGVPQDSTLVDTEVQVVESRSLAEQVVADLKLDQDPEFNPELHHHSAFSLKGMVSAAMPGGAKAVSQVEVDQRAHQMVVDRVMKAVNARRAGLTYVIGISATSINPRKAATIANKFADVYITSQVVAKFDATRKASDELQSRIGGVQQAAEAADAELQQYKIANNLMSAQGTTLTEQSISDLGQRLAQARMQQAEADAELATAMQQLRSGSNGEDVGEALDSPVVQDLRKQRAEASQMLAQVRQRYGERHPEVQKAKGQVGDVDDQIHQEIARIISNLKAKAEVARQRTAAAASSLGSMRSALESNNRASVHLNELQNKATSTRAIYEAFLNRFKETTATEGLEQADARILSMAAVPSVPSYPNKTLFAALGLLLGIGAGVGIVILLEMLDSGLATAEDVENEFGIPFVGNVPTVASTSDEATDMAPADLVALKPLSAFSEAFRNLRASLVFSRGIEAVKVVAITSSMPGEGKTTTSLCLARTAALAGSSVVLVDCDLRRRASTHFLVQGEPLAGLLEVLSGSARLEEALVQDPKTGMLLLPLARSAHTAQDVFGTEPMHELIARLKARFDLVVLDTAPVLSVAETRIVAQAADAVVLLARWRKTPRKAVEASVRILRSSGVHVTGIALSLVDMQHQAKYGYGDAGYYYRSYSEYYSE